MKIDFEAILDRAGLSGTIQPIGDGLYNDSFYINGDNETFVLRVAPEDTVPQLFYEKRMMRSEPGIHTAVLEQTTVPAPGVIFHDFSRETIGRDYIILEYLEGRPGSFDEFSLGQYVRQLHDVQSETYGYPDRSAPTDHDWPSIFLKYWRLIFNDCLECEIIVPDEYEWFIDIYNEYGDAVTETPACLLHLDLWSQNILTVDGEISAILDFDRGLYGDPELEFAVLDTYGFCTPEFFEGYGRRRPDSTEAEIRQKLYIVYELIKYAFIRYARGDSYGTGRRHVDDCREILEAIEN